VQLQTSDVHGRHKSKIDENQVKISAKGCRTVRFGILAMSIALAGCAAGNIVQYLPDPPLPADLSEPNYRQIVADNIGSAFPNQTSLGTLEISGVRPVNHLRGLAWLTCLRIHADSAPQEYAVFILGDKIVDLRIGVVIDRCRQQTYEAFDLSAFVQRKKAGR
jgi:hypothetical protein